MNNKHMPNNPNAERASLGAILLDPDLMTAIELQPGDFYNETHRAIFEAMRSLWDSGMPVDFALVQDELDRVGKLGDLVQVTDLTSLIADVPSAIYGPHYAAVVKRASIARQWIGMAQQLVSKAFDDANTDSLYAWVMEQVAIINSGRADDKALLMWDESFAEFRRILERDAIAREEGLAGWTWPWHSWTEILGEAQPGGLVLCAGATGTGKTTFAECIAEHWARAGKRVVLVHLELNRKVMFARRMARHSGLDFRAITSNSLAASQRRLMDATDEQLQFYDGKINYLHAPGWTAEAIVKELARLQDRGECDGFIVDYLQKVRPSQSQTRMYRGEQGQLNWAADNVEQFKNFAEQKELIACMFSQLTKDGQEISFDDLDYTKLRGTQEIADRVNQILLFHRQRLPGGRVNEKGQMIVPKGGLDIVARTKVAKNTFGPHGVIEQMIVPEQFNVFDK